MSGTSRPQHVLVIRHGATAASVKGLFTGRGDVPLTAAGRAEAARWAPVLDAQPAESRCSPLSRARETASLAGLQAVHDDLLTEWDLGTLEGQKADAFRAAHPDWNLFVDGVPDGSGESAQDVTARARAAWDVLSTSPAPLSVAVSHGQYIRVLLATVVGMPIAAAARFSLGPARAALVSARGARWSVTGWNLSALPLEHSLLADLT